MRKQECLTNLEGKLQGQGQIELGSKWEGYQGHWGCELAQQRIQWQAVVVMNL
jgi:hypothetical protein